MTALLDLDAYFARIRWGGETTPTLATLSGLLDAHMANIPFENLDVLLGRPIRLDIASVQNKLVHERRGGYCFEHGTLFAAVLESLGFRPLRHTARVVPYTPRDAAPRTHMFLKVPLAEGTFVVDPGFGGLAPRFPVPLTERAMAHAAAETHWMIRDGAYWVLRARTGDTAVDAWVSTLDLDHPVDFEVGNLYTANAPDSIFVNRLLMRAFTSDGRVTVMNRDVTRYRGGECRVEQLADRNALRAVLVEHFGFDLAEVERLRVPSIPEWT